jgi:uncharacterized membrane protein YphA (DoxX/SURF4 family)
MTPQTRTRLRRWLLIVGRLALGALFLFAAYGKLRPVDSAPFTLASLKITPNSLDVSMMMFAMQIDSYQMLPSWGVMALSHTLPWLELALGLFLVSGLLLRWVSLLTTLLLTVFFAVLVHSYLAGMQINCGCFGPGAEKLTGSRLLLEVLFLAVALGVTVGAFFEARSRRSSLTAVPPANPAQAAPAD